MKEPKNWLLGVIIIAIVGYVVPRIGDIVSGKDNTMTHKLDNEIVELIKDNKKTEVFIIIEGKKTEVKPNSDGEIEIKVSEEDDGKTAELKVVDEKGNELKKKDIVLLQPKPILSGFPLTHTTKENYKIEFIEIKRDANNITIHYNVTNLDKEFRELVIAHWGSMFYTDVATQHEAIHYCIAEKCSRNHRRAPSNRMPPNIALAGKAIVPMDKAATKILLANFKCGNEVFDLENIPLPSI